MISPRAFHFEPLIEDNRSSFFDTFRLFGGGRYQAVNAMLLNEFLKSIAEVEQQQASIGRLKF